LCCDYSEDTTTQVAENYGLEFSSVEECDTDGEFNHVRAYLMDHTTVVAEFDGKFLYVQF
tara:strand:- start:2959 stop:3138 length:180 start_codon:yes stop_codon:yes gene_type:complete